MKFCLLYCREDLANSDGGLWSFKIRKEDTVSV